MADTKIRVGITQGDINGIGYEVILKTLADPRIVELCTPVVYGSPRVAAYYRKTLHGLENFSFNAIRSASEANSKRANIISVMSDEAKVELGKPSKEALQGGLAALSAAVQDLKDGKIQALVTAPLSKQSVQECSFPGHTEFLMSAFGAKEELRLFVCDTLRVALATGHTPLAKVPAALTKELLLRKLRLLNDTLKKDFLVNKPRIAVLGLNPHADDGAAAADGSEEQQVIIPAVTEAIKTGILAFGPYAAEDFFNADSARFDGVLALYHDQGIAPFKVFARGQGVSYTCGLPVIRTSPVHGPTYDIVGADKASPDSFRAALYLACDAYKNRKEYAEMTKNPLPNAKFVAEKQ
ncbi:MAG: 4-hydroxythreonine-4-phosphate dehydrogenase PdxA [Prevotellaceae bacterium]|jgi:4-hydroxythreonine-4-phosphate dehydrogenase|nr:4-hydroxythreonine-4-phosphate dehydrogenase PdxA [Prevotellaceae bacterium]